MKVWKIREAERRTGARTFSKPAPPTVDTTEWVIYHSKYHLGSTQNTQFAVSKPFTRLKEALGQLRMLYNSHLMVMLNHDHFGDSFHILPKYFVVFGHENGKVTYYHRFYLVKVERTVTVDSSVAANS